MKGEGEGHIFWRKAFRSKSIRLPMKSFCSLEIPVYASSNQSRHIKRKSILRIERRLSGFL